MGERRDRRISVNRPEDTYSDDIHDAPARPPSRERNIEDSLENRSLEDDEFTQLLMQWAGLPA